MLEIRFEKTKGATLLIWFLVDHSVEANLTSS
jgi:hypothetical protein